MWYAKLDAHTGTVNASFGYATIPHRDGNAVLPIGFKATILGTTNITFTSSTVSWTKINFGFGGNNHVPASATHCFIQLNRFSDGAGNMYVDDINMNVW
jgi:hypothetical protein